MEDRYPLIPPLCTETLLVPSPLSRGEAGADSRAFTLPNGCIPGGSLLVLSTHRAPLGHSRGTARERGRKSVMMGLRESCRGLLPARSSFLVWSGSLGAGGCRWSVADVFWRVFWGFP